MSANICSFWPPFVPTFVFELQGDGLLCISFRSFVSHHHRDVGLAIWHKLAESQIYKLKAARAKHVINFHDNFFLLWCFCPCCILCPSQMEQIYIWPRLTQKQHDVCSLLFFAHIVSLFSLSFWNLACTHSPVSNIMSKLQFGKLKRSSFKLHVTLWISWFSSVGCAG